MTKKQRITLLASKLKELADKFGIVLGKKADVNWCDDCKEVYFRVLELPGKNRVVRAMNAQSNVPMYMIMNVEDKILFDVDSLIVLECPIDRFSKGAMKRLEQYITQNYQHSDLIP